MAVQELKYHVVPKEVESRIRALAAASGNQLIYCCRSSNHLEDAHSYLAILYNKASQSYIFYGYNAQANSFYWGHYNITFKEAFRILSEKIWDTRAQS